MLAKLSLAELKAMYREVAGREARYSDSSDLVWKLRQAKKGRIRVGPIERRPSSEADEAKVLQLHITGAELEALDEAWHRLGFKIRTAMIRASINSMLASPA